MLRSPTSSTAAATGWKRIDFSSKARPSTAITFTSFSTPPAEQPIDQEALASGIVVTVSSLIDSAASESAKRNPWGAAKFVNSYLTNSAAKRIATELLTFQKNVLELKAASADADIQAQDFPACYDEDGLYINRFCLEYLGSWEVIRVLIPLNKDEASHTTEDVCKRDTVILLEMPLSSQNPLWDLRCLPSLRYS